MVLLKRVSFLSGQLGLMVLVRFFFSWNLKFADTRSVEGEILLDTSIVGLVFFAARIFDGVTDPIAGWLADRWVRRGHERRTLLWFSVAVPAAGLVLIFLPSHDMSVTLRWVCLVSGMFLFFVGYTLYAIPYWSLTNDYGESEKDRRVLSTLLGTGLILATAVVGILSPILVDSFGFLPTALIFVLPCIVAMALPYFAAPKGYGAKPGTAVSDGVAAAHATQGSILENKAPSILRQLIQALKHRRFLALLLIFSGSQMAFTVVTATAPFIATVLLGGTNKDVAKIMAPFLGTAIPCFLIAPYLSKRFGWERLFVVASLALAVVYGGAAGLGKAWIGSPMTTAMLVFATAGPMAAILLALEAEAITDCAREAGGNRVSLYFGVFNFVVKGLNGAAIAITGVLVTLAGDPKWEHTAVRLMPMLAGTLLVVGVIGYTIVRPRKQGDAPK